MRQINGNIKAPSLRIIHWNKRSSKFSNKIDDIKLVIDKFRPHIFSIVEANYDLMERQTIEGYNIETDNIGLGTNLARTILLIDKQINSLIPCVSKLKNFLTGIFLDNTINLCF